MRWCVAGALVLVFSLTSAGGVRRSEAGFVAILAQTKTYLNILIDEWEKYSRILEDHLDKVTGVMQPFSEIHAGVRELTNVHQLRGVYRMMDSYRASVTDPACYASGSSWTSTCSFQRDFEPPDLREVRVAAHAGVAAGQYTLHRLEGEIFDRSGSRTVQETVRTVLGVVDPELANIQRRIEMNVDRHRWQVRRIRSIGNRGRYAARNFQRWGGPARRLAGTPGMECSALDVSDLDGPDGVAGTHDDPTILDQALNADCLGSAAHVDDPLAEQAHLSEMEAKTLRTAGLVGVVEMSALEVERQVVRDAEALASAERVEEQRRREVERHRQRLNCVATTGSFAYVDSSGACLPVVSAVESGRRYAAQEVSLLP
ncbi:MAG: hypothetical protein F4137_12265 [Acidobacteria bacterium]|nr:hypothetical protein [Acidobacteriota bacterium]